MSPKPIIDFTHKLELINEESNEETYRNIKDKAENNSSLKKICMVDFDKQTVELSLNRWGLNREQFFKD